MVVENDLKQVVHFQCFITSTLLIKGHKMGVRYFGNQSRSKRCFINSYLYSDIYLLGGAVKFYSLLFE